MLLRIQEYLTILPAKAAQSSQEELDQLVQRRNASRAQLDDLIRRISDYWQANLDNQFKAQGLVQVLDADTYPLPWTRAVLEDKRERPDDPLLLLVRHKPNLDESALHAKSRLQWTWYEGDDKPRQVVDEVRGELAAAISDVLSRRPA